MSKTKEAETKTVLPDGVVVNDNDIQLTEDYSIFKYIEGNRKIVDKHVAEIMDKIMQNDMFIPILCNEKMEIVDGQHTLKARQNLKLIVPYYIRTGAGLADVQLINTGQRPWTVDDYAYSYATRGNPHYLAYQKFRERYKFPHIISVQMLHAVERGHGKNSEVFKNGLLKIADIKAAEAKANQIERIAPFFRGYRDRPFLQAILQLFENPHFDFEVFMKKLEVNPLMMKKCANSEQYIEQMEYVYNYRSRDKVWFRNYYMSSRGPNQL
jgi:hypothetical protein